MITVKWGRNALQHLLLGHHFNRPQTATFSVSHILDTSRSCVSDQRPKAFSTYSATSLTRHKPTALSRVGFLRWIGSHALKVTREESGYLSDSGLSKPRRRVKREITSKKGFSVSGFSTGAEYDLEQLKAALLKQQLYRVVEDERILRIQEAEGSPSDVLYIVANYAVEEEPREVFFFREGTAVFWNVSELEMTNMLRFIRPYELSPYHEKVVLNEQEIMSYIHSGSKKSIIQHGTIHLADSIDQTLEKYTFSNGIALSVKLGVWEASLEKFVDSIEFITADLKKGNKIRMSREEVLCKQGELFELRHLINLSSDLLDTPDFYWDNDELESLFMQTIAYFSINRRTRVMNEKLNHCAELVELVSSHLNDKHHVRLEWMIIVLIMVEVLFEVLHFIR